MASSSISETPAVSLPPVERRWILASVWLVCLLALCGTCIADPDLWGHTLYGLRAQELGVLSERTDPFSFTAAGAEWINHEWLSEYQLGWLWKRWGSIGLLLWRNGFVLLLWMVVASALRQARCGTAAAVLLLVLNAEVLSDFVVFVRPQLPTFAFFGLFLLLLRSWWERPHKLIWCLPCVMVAWTNLHGGFLAGIGVLGVVTVAAILRAAREPNQRRSTMEFVATAVLTVMATAINPYGLRMHVMLWDHLVTEQFVREWQPVWSLGFTPVLAVPFVLTLLSLAFSRRWKAIDVALLLVVGWQATWHLRHVALLSIAVLILLSGPMTDVVATLFPELLRRWSGPQRRPRRLIAVAAICVFLLGIQVRVTAELLHSNVAPWEIAVETRGQVPGMPVSAVRWLAEQRISGNLLTEYGWGQFLIWHLWPEIKVAFDGRYRTVYSAELEQHFLNWQRGDERQQVSPLLDDFPTEIVLVPSDQRLDRWLARRSDWVCVQRDSQAVIYLKDLPKFAAWINARRQSPRREGQQSSHVRRDWEPFPVKLHGGTPVAIHRLD